MPFTGTFVFISLLRRASLSRRAPLAAQSARAAIDRRSVAWPGARPTPVQRKAREMRGAMRAERHALRNRDAELYLKYEIDALIRGSLSRSFDVGACFRSRSFVADSLGNCEAVHVKHVVTGAVNECFSARLTDTL